MNRVLVVFSDELLAQVDAARGLASRSAWIRSWCEHGIRVENEWPAVEAVAPLVPDENWDAFSVGQLEKAVEARRIPTNAEFDAHKAKPKARRKKVAIVDPATATDSEIEKAKAAGWKIPSRCNRGACPGTLHPISGSCNRCMQKPLKESK